jgi:protein ImuB
MRFLVVWCPDWPAVAAGCPPEIPAAVVAAGEVVAVTPAARQEGVRRGLRRREAQARCPGLELVPADPGRDARMFEPVVVTLEGFTPEVEITRPGVAAFATRGPSRYFGGDLALAVAVAGALRPLAPGAAVGVADGRFAAELAARAAAGGDPVVVPPGGSPAFLAPHPIRVLPDRALADLLSRLGLTTLGALAGLPADSVLARFGIPGRVAHRLACGADDRPLAARVPPRDLAVAVELDPPAERSDVAAFAARSLAAELHQQLAEQGLVCSQVTIEAETEHGEHLSRRWRHEGLLDAPAIAERVRWQLDGWLARGGTTGGLSHLRLVPSEVVAEGGRQLGFWGDVADGDGGMDRCLARVQGLLGPEGVLTAVVGGGRGLHDAVRLVPWGDPRVPSRPSGAPWPGRLPAPAPAVMHTPPLPAEVRDARGGAVTVSGRGLLSAPPAVVSVANGPCSAVEGWAGPWPLEERWWEGERRCARIQVVTTDGAALLLSRERGGWWVEATYD